MKQNSIAMAVAIGLLVAGCGGGGGGTSGGTGSGGGVGNSPTQVEPVTDGPVTITPVTAGTAVYSGARSFYRISRTGSDFMVANTRLTEASRVSGAQFIRFADITVNLGIGARAAALDPARLKSLIELYMAFHQRVPDADGLGALIDQVNAGRTLAQIADKLHADVIQTPGLTGWSAGMLNAEFVVAAYKDVFGMTGASAPSAGDIESWASRIDKGGITRGALIIAMLSAARTGYPGLSSAAVTSLLDNRADVGDYVAAQQGINYNTVEESLSRRRAIAEAVTSADKTVAQSMLGFADTLNLKVAGK